MAQVTIELRNLLKIQNFNLFDFDYPVISPSWKEEFERTFIEVYYDYEIGSETPDRFKQRLKARLNLIMPRYIEQHRKLELLEDPFLLEKVEESIKTIEGKKTDENLNLNSSLNSESRLNTTNTDYPQHTVIGSDIPSVKSEELGDSDSYQSSTQLNSINSDLDRDVIKVLTKTGNNLDLVQKLLVLQNNFTEKIVNEMRTLFILVY